MFWNEPLRSLFRNTPANKLPPQKDVENAINLDFRGLIINNQQENTNIVGIPRLILEFRYGKNAIKQLLLEGKLQIHPEYRERLFWVGTWHINKI